MYCNKPADQLIQIIRKQIVHLPHHKKRGCNPLEQYFKLLNCYILFSQIFSFQFPVHQIMDGIRRFLVFKQYRVYFIGDRH